MSEVNPIQLLSNLEQTPTQVTQQDEISSDDETSVDEEEILRDSENPEIFVRRVQGAPLHRHSR